MAKSTMHGQTNQHRIFKNEHKKKIHYDGFCFSHKRELERYKFLKGRLENGEIRDLTVKKEFELGNSEYGALRALNGKPLRYFVDFSYVDVETGQIVYEDVKKHLDEFANCKKQILQMFKHITIKIVA